MSSDRLKTFWARLLAAVESLTPRKVTRWTLIGIALSIGLGLAIGNPEWQFGEGKLITWISFALLLSSALTCYGIFVTRSGRTGPSLRGTTSIWLIIAFGFAFLALDEAWEVHERLDRLGHVLLGVEQTGLSDRADDLIIAAYGLIGLGVLWVYRGELLRYPALKTYLVAGFCLLLLQVAIDLTTNGKEYLAVLKNDLISRASIKSFFEIAEEVAKIAAEAAFLLGFISVRDSLRSAPAPFAA